jgi:RimJ/RimL family protein N-acetyltransferase
MEYLGGVSDRAGTWRLMAVTLGHWQLRGYGVWAVEESSTGGLVGRAGLFNQVGWPGIEVTWALIRSHWGFGYATEAGQAVIDYAFNTLDLDQVIALVHPDNVASARVAEKLGMKYEFCQDLFGETHFTYVLRRDAR